MKRYINLRVNKWLFETVRAASRIEDLRLKELEHAPYWGTDRVFQFTTKKACLELINRLVVFCCDYPGIEKMPNGQAYIYAVSNNKGFKIDFKEYR